MSKTFTKTLLAISLTAGVAGLAQAADKVVHVLNWSDYIAPNTVENFTKETGIKVVYDVFDSNETLEAKLFAGKSGYDVVVPSNNFLAKQIKAGAYQKLDRSKLPNWENLDPNLLKTVSVSDPDNAYAVPYMWGTIGLGYNIDKVKAALGDDAPVDSWEILFNTKYLEKLKGCGVSILDSATEILPIGLQYLGYDPLSQDAKQLKEAEALFAKIRPYITYFHSSRYISDMANGNLCLAVVYSGDVIQSKNRAEEAKNGVRINYNIPKEGAGAFFDMLGIPADADNVDEAHTFLNYILRPDVSAEITNFVQFPSGNTKALPMVDESLRNDPGVYPSEEVMKKIYAFPDLPAKVQRAMTRSWTTIKSGK